MQGQVLFGLLEWVTQVSLPGINRFKWVEAINDNREVELFEVGGNFRRQYMDVVQLDVEPVTLDVFHLIKAETDPAIIATLRKEERPFQTQLAHMWMLLEKQPKGPESEPGPLLTDGHVNVFYVPWAGPASVNAVCAHWKKNVGWRIGADSLEHPRAWMAESHIFCRV